MNAGPGPGADDTPEPEREDQAFPSPAEREAPPAPADSLDAPEGPEPGSRAPLPWEAMSAHATGAHPHGPEPVVPASVAVSATEDTPQRASAGTAALLLTLGALVIALLAVGGFALKLWSDRAAAQEALVAAVGTMSAATPGGLPGAPATGLAEVKAAIDRGRFAEAASRLRSLTARATRAPLGELEGAGRGLPMSGFGMGGPPPAAGEGAGGSPPTTEAQQPSGAGRQPLPPGAAEFFEQNPKIAKLFGEAAVAGVKLRQEGGDIARLKQIHDSMIEAARLHDTEGVLKLLEEYKQEFQVQVQQLGGAPRGSGPGGRG